MSRYNWPDPIPDQSVFRYGPGWVITLTPLACVDDPTIHFCVGRCVEPETGKVLYSCVGLDSDQVGEVCRAYLDNQGRRVAMNAYARRED